ncbi:MAG: hypothetical protein NTY03_01685 [Candidatus Bathyarchaeota archaeon]|nr:hypothetical protein [Candidatus Bathyarchaeota archaeon]
MKKNAILTLSLVMALTILSITAVIPVSAKNIPYGSYGTVYSYSGKVYSYFDPSDPNGPPDPNPSAVVVGGN